MIAPLLERLLRARLLVPGIVVLFVARTCYTSALLWEPGGWRTPTDFHAFWVAGQLAADGLALQAYDLEQFMAAQRRLLGESEFLPFTYPLHATMMMMMLAPMPLWLGNLLFGLASIALFMVGVRRLAGPQLPLVLLAVLPGMITCLRTGQNGMAMAGLMALFARAALAGRWPAGIALALMTVKPHFLSGAGLWLLGRRAWSILLVGGLVTLGLLGLATAVLQPAAWPAFLHAVGQASGFLQEGRYPLHRMNSVYATLFRAGLEPGLALSLHGLVAAAWLGVLLWSARARWPAAQQLAVALFFTMALTPYGYDYDVGMAGIALALVAADARDRASANELVLMCLLLWVAGLSGVVMTDAYAGQPDAEAELKRMPALGGLALQAMAMMLVGIVRRPQPNPVERG